MPTKIDIELTPEQQAEMAQIPATSWFTQIEFANAKSPTHTNPAVGPKNDMKRAMVIDWIDQSVRGKRVLDLFSANGAFAFEAANAHAREVIGVEFSEERVACAQWVARQMTDDCRLEFRHGDVYQIAEEFDEPFDVTLCLGGLYHVADPAYVLERIGRVTTETLIMQTSHVISSSRNVARFEVRREDRTRKGMTSLRQGHGVWYYSPACIRELLLHGGFEVIEERLPPRRQRKKFAWYAALCKRI